MNVLKRLDAAIAVKHDAGWNANVSTRWSNAGALAAPPTVVCSIGLHLTSLCRPRPGAERATDLERTRHYKLLAVGQLSVTFPGTSSDYS